MLVEFYIFFQILTIALFFLAFFTKQEIVWGLSAVISAVLMFTAFDVETYVYQFNSTLQAYSPILITNSHPYLMGINLLFFALAIILGLFDMFDKYGSRFAGKK